MRRLFLPLLVAAGLACNAAPASANHFHIDTDQCNYRTDYDVLVERGGVRFERDDGTPSRVYMHAGAVRVDGRELDLSAADAQRVRDYEAEVRKVLPEMAGIAREGIDLGFSAMTTVAATFAEDGPDRERAIERLKTGRADAMRRVDETLGRGQWRHDAMGELVGHAVENAVPELVSNITARAVKAALSGDRTQVAALEARADALDKAIDRQVDARADRLGERAEALCPSFAHMQSLQQQWQFRLPDGTPLQLIERDHEKHRRIRGDDDQDTVVTR